MNRKRIARFDRVSLKTLAEEIDAALAPIAERHGITLKLGSTRFDEGEFRSSIIGASDAKAEADRTRLADAAKWNGMDVAKVGPKGERLVDFKARSRTRPWIVSHTDGKRYEYSTALAQRMFAASEAAPAIAPPQPGADLEGGAQ